MASNPTQVQLFNLETMSGVSPGIRTQIIQRIYLSPRPGRATGVTENVAGWARLLWYAGPDSTTQADTVEGAFCVVQRQAETGVDRWSQEPLLLLPAVESTTVNRSLQTALQAEGLAPHICGACSNWQVTGARTMDGLPAGRCTAASGGTDRPDIFTALAQQAVFAPGCSRWRPVDSALPDDPIRSAAADPALPRAAVLDTEQEAAARGMWARIRRAAGRRIGRSSDRAPQRRRERLEERSGVGAGTEPCFACQGRIANLGALTVATDEHDKHTYSVWRCRVCYAAYLNSWIDRWERLDNLETEETYFRLAPAEAVEALAVIDGVAGGEHPAGRVDRGEQRAWFEHFITGLPVLSHQRKQGR